MLKDKFNIRRDKWEREIQERKQNEKGRQKKKDNVDSGRRVCFGLYRVNLYIING